MYSAISVGSDAMISEKKGMRSKSAHARDASPSTRLQQRHDVPKPFAPSTPSQNPSSSTPPDVGSPSVVSSSDSPHPLSIGSLPLPFGVDAVGVPNPFPSEPVQLHFGVAGPVYELVVLALGRVFRVQVELSDGEVAGTNTCRSVVVWEAFMNELAEDELRREKLGGVEGAVLVAMNGCHDGVWGGREADMVDGVVGPPVELGAGGGKGNEGEASSGIAMAWTAEGVVLLMTGCDICGWTRKGFWLC